MRVGGARAVAVDAAQSIVRREFKHGRDCWENDGIDVKLSGPQAPGPACAAPARSCEACDY